jgi:tellurite resistance protein TerC
MRGAMIAVGVALIHRFGWLLYVFGAFLVFTGVKMSFSDKDSIEPEKNPVLRLARKFFSVTPDFVGRKFFTRTGGRFLLTPLALVLLLVETTDLIFAVDSVPAVFSVTQNAFIVFTSNVFAILGLRSLYFVLAGALGYFRYLKFGLSVVLVFVGAKMLLDPHGQPEKWFQVEIPTNVSLMIVGTVVLIAIVLSTMVAEREKRTKQTGKNINHG